VKCWGVEVLSVEVSVLKCWVKMLSVVDAVAFVFCRAECCDC
jgi:hypothetical protein